MNLFTFEIFEIHNQPGESGGARRDAWNRQSMIVDNSRVCRARPLAALASRRMRNASCARARAAYAVRGCVVARTDEVYHRTRRYSGLSRGFR